MKKYFFPLVAVCLSLFVLGNTFSWSGLRAAVIDGDSINVMHVQKNKSAPPFSYGALENNNNNGGAYMKLKVGSTAPEFAASDNNDINRNLSSLIKDGPVVLVFLRGFS